MSESTSTAWKGVGVSAMLHLAVGGAILGTVAGVREVSPPSQPAMSVELAPAPAAPPAPPVQMAPGEERQQTEEETTAETAPEQLDLPPIPVVRVPNAPVMVSVQPKDSPKPADEPKVAQARVEQTTAPASVPLPPSKVAGAPTEGTPSVNDAVAQQTWEGKVLARLERKKRYPPDSMKAGEEDKVFVRITVDRSGRVIGAQVIKSRNIARLNAAALDQVKRSNPLPAPPSSTPGSAISFVVPLNFFMASGGVR